MKAKTTTIANRYEIKAKCGEGAYGKVYLATDKQKNIDVAIKKIKINSVEEGVPISSIREIGLQKELVHINIVRLNDVIHLGSKILLVFEYVDTDLKKIIKDKGGKLSPEEVKSYVYQLIRGMQYVHRLKVLHRDLKTENLLVTKNNVLKVADFGLARSFGLPISQFRNDVVSLWYRSPDILLGNESYTTSVDMWSIGCIFGELATGQIFFKGFSENEQIMKIFEIMGTPDEKKIPVYTTYADYKKFKETFNKTIEPTPLSKLCPNLDADGCDLLGKLLDLNPETRITATDALNHPYFKNLPDEVKNLYKE